MQGVCARPLRSPNLLRKSIRTLAADRNITFIVHSDFRQVPDNQEVLVRDDSDTSLIVEVLQLAIDEGADESLDKAVR